MLPDNKKHTSKIVSLFINYLYKAAVGRVGQKLTYYFTNVLILPRALRLPLKIPPLYDSNYLFNLLFNIPCNCVQT